MGCGSSQQDVEANNKTATKRSFTNQNISADIFVTIKDGNIFDTYESKQTLGEGAFGSVKLVCHKKTKMLRAMKQIKKSSLLKEDQLTLFNEMDILKSIDHPNIVKLHELYQDRMYYFLITDFCEGGELFDRLTSENNFTEKKAAIIMKQILSAVVYCHQRDIIHRDLKLENILFETKKNDSNLKVIDFGTSRKVKNDEKLKLRIGTLYYMAPQVFQGNYDIKCDVWSVGVILYILLCGYPPFNGDDQQIRSKIQSGKFSFPEQEWNGISDGAKSLIRQMLTFDPEQRISSVQALNDPWIQSRAPNSAINNNVLNNLNKFYSSSKLRNAIELFIVTQVTSHQEKEELMKQFKAIDANGDGTLSREELLQCYTKNHGEAKATDMVNEIMRQVDTNESGKIDFTEFLVAAANKEKLVSQQKLKQVFSVFDKNGDGKIQRAELQYIMSGITIDDNGWLKILEECDQDKDGEISLEELIVLMQKLN